MKKINILLVTVLTMTLAASCSKNQEPAIKKHPVTLRLSENHVSGYPTSLADEEFARLVELKTEGRVKVEVREGGALAQNEGDAIEGLQSGDLAFTRVSSSSVAAYVSQINAIQFPYLYRDSDHMWKVLNGKIGQDILKGIENSASGLVGLCYYDGGSRNFYVTKPIHSVKDMEGLKIRVMNSRILFWTSTHEFQKSHWAGQNVRSATQYFITQKKLHPEPS